MLSRSFNLPSLVEIRPLGATRKFGTYVNHIRTTTSLLISFFSCAVHKSHRSSEKRHGSHGAALCKKLPIRGLNAYRTVHEA